MNKINVYSECDKLKTVLVHRPSGELKNIYPEILDQLLFDELPYLEMAQKEHDYFVDKLKDEGVEVIYCEDLVEEVLKDKKIKELFIEEFVDEALDDVKEKEIAKDFYNKIQNEKDLVEAFESGIRSKEIIKSYDIKLDRKLFIPPMPNLYFQRDPFSFIGEGVAISNFRYDIRKPETLFAKYIFKYHKDFKDTPIYYDRDCEGSLEGGDIIVLSDKILAVGISQRTSFDAIKQLSKNLLPNSKFEKVLAISIPKRRESMHLDTVFTVVDHNKFLVHSMASETTEIFTIEYDGDLIINKENDNLLNTLKKHYRDDVEFIKCGGDSEIDGSRDQWNDGANCLCIKPSEIVVYDRNTVTNKILQDKNIETVIIKSGELSRGRGGPRCMSMPIRRLND
ncbi:MAG: arginine deiminase [Tissierellia bacterium]|nr:arginine deiminase [Tissierellia bacterium]